MGKFIFIFLLLGLIVLAVYAGFNTISLAPRLTEVFKKIPNVIVSSTPTPILATPTPGLSNDVPIINSYLVSVLGIKSHDGGKIICAHQVLDSVTKHPGLIFIWAVCQEYYQNKSDWQIGSGISVPVALVFTRSADSLQIISHRTPRAGNLYNSDITEIFPGDITLKVNLDPIQNEITAARVKL